MTGKAVLLSLPEQTTELGRLVLQLALNYLWPASETPEGFNYIVMVILISLTFNGDACLKKS